jgi:uncharacterized repeat protein (TIGR03843 family)
MLDFSRQPQISDKEALKLLECGELQETHGLIPWSSNYTFLIALAADGREALAVYKPRRGERPLWDFPEGTLCQRECAAFLISEALGWGLVPPTILRDGPHGLGSVQFYIPHNPDENYFTFGAKYERQLQRIALFDSIINNADRKGGHCLLDEKGRIRAIDHGVCFHTQPKLRTVIWDFEGKPIPSHLMADLEQLCMRLGKPPLSDHLKPLLTDDEIDALRERLDALMMSRKFPRPGPGRNYPWPPI